MFAWKSPWLILSTSALSIWKCIYSSPPWKYHLVFWVVFLVFHRFCWNRCTRCQSRGCWNWLDFANFVHWDTCQDTTPIVYWQIFRVKNGAFVFCYRNKWCITECKAGEPFKMFAAAMHEKHMHVNMQLLEGKVAKFCIPQKTGSIIKSALMYIFSI